MFFFVLYCLLLDFTTQSPTFHLYSQFPTPLSPLFCTVSQLCYQFYTPYPLSVRVPPHAQFLKPCPSLYSFPIPTPLILISVQLCTSSPFLSICCIFSSFHPSCHFSPSSCVFSQFHSFFPFLSSFPVLLPFPNV